MNPLTCALLLLPQGDAKLPVMRPGTTVRAEVTKNDPLVRPRRVPAYKANEPVRGRAYELRIDEAGEYTIELRSRFFDAYLVLRNARGRPLEDDDGALNTHARVVRKLPQGTYRVEVCALRGQTGPFELTAEGGAPPLLAGPARMAAEIEDIKATIAAREQTVGLDALVLADALDQHGKLLWRSGRFADALPVMQRQLDIVSKHLGPRHLRTGYAMFQLGAQLQGLGRFGAAEELYRKSISIQEELGGDQHPNLATTLCNLGALLNQQGRQGEAERVLRRAVAILERAHGTESMTFGKVLSALGGALEWQGHYPEAEEQFRRALGILDKRLGPGHADHGTGLSNLARVLARQGKYGEAEPIARRALAVSIRTRGGRHPSIATTLGHLATLLAARGRHAEAEELQRRALRIREEAFDAYHPEIAVTLANLGQCLKEQGKLAEAETLLLRAQRIFEQTHGRDSENSASVVLLLGGISWNRGRLADADRHFREGLRIQQECLREGHPKTAVSLSELGVLAHEQGRDTEAEELCRRALRFRERSLGTDHTHVAESLNNLATILESRGDHGEAEQSYRRALAIYEKSFGADHPHAAIVLNNLSVLLARLGRFDEANGLATRRCAGGLRYAVRELARSTGEGRFRLGRLQQLRLDLLLSYISYADDKQIARDTAWRHVTAWKGLVFRVSSRMLRATRAGGLAATRDRLDTLIDRLGALRYATKIPDPKVHAGRFERLLAEKHALEQKVLAALAIVPEREQTDARELASLLPAGSAMLDFIVHRPYLFTKPDEEAVGNVGREAERVLCFVARPSQPHVALIDLGDAKALASAVDRFLRHTAREPRGEPLAGEPGTELRKKLLEPLLPKLGNTNLLFVSADGNLAKLPFGAIPTTKDRCLLQDCNVVYVQDPVTLRNRLAAKRNVVVVQPTLFAVGGIEYARCWPPLDGTGGELDDLVRRFGKRATTRRGKAATEEAVLRHAAGKSILHLATHGFFERRGVASLWEAALQATREAKAGGLGRIHDDRGNAFRPPLQGEPPGLLAGLVFSATGKDAPAGRRDGVLTASEVAQLDLSACDFAVLSACETALGTARSGEGLLSLRRAFREAGAKTVVSTLWKVDDRPTRELINEFYRLHLDNKQSPADALRNARLRLRRSDDYASPRYWGAFVLAGEWR